MTAPAPPTPEAAERGALLAFEFAQRHLRPDGIVLTKGAQQNLANAFAALAAQAQRDAEAVSRLQARMALDLRTVREWAMSKDAPRSELLAWLDGREDA